LFFNYLVREDILKPQTLKSKKQSSDSLKMLTIYLQIKEMRFLDFFLIFSCVKHFQKNSKRI